GMDRVEAWAPYVTLGIGSVLELLAVVGEPSRAPLTLLLAATALGWVYFMYTRPGTARDNQPRLLVYFAGLLVISAVMMAYRPGFFVFVITGFVHAFLLKSPTFTF